MPDSIIYRVAVPSPLRRLFDYLPPADGDPAPGCRVKVPFGRRTLVGLVVAKSECSDQPADNLRPIAEVLDRQPLIAPTLFELFLWAAHYYQHPVGDALLSALPVLLRRGEAPEAADSQFWTLSARGQGLPDDPLPRAPRQAELVQLLRRHGCLDRQALREHGVSAATLKQLRDKQLVEPTATADDHQTGAEELLAEAPLTLYPAQQQVLDRVELHGFQPYLLQGETGSGKTEVYLQLIEKVVRYGRQALLLIPEISLTPQTLERFRRRFRCTIAVMHSGLTDRERLAAWNDARTGRAAIVIGTRSGVFVPLKSPGMIIVDEEHDSSYKQQDGFRYSARDLAVMRASREKIPILLASATPSLESLHNGRQGRYTHLRLTERPGTAVQPEWHLVDIRHSPLTTGLSRELIEAVRAELRGGNQVLVFLNRRGYAPVLMCHDCGWTAVCRHCDRRMTSHRRENRLRCHHCEASAPIPRDCPDCRSPALQFLGQGTERGEALLGALFPEAPVLRIDRDTTRRKHAMRDMVARVTKGEPCILLGTQMIAKGHHFPDVTLVAILDADGVLFSADFRATERMGQLITQVAGRAGRGDKPGRVMIQSHHCDHPLIRQLTEEGYDRFADTLLAERAANRMPPWVNLAVVRAESENPDRAEQLLRKAREWCQAEHPADPVLHYLGPLPSPMEKRAGRYRFQLSLLSESRPLLQKLLTGLCRELENEPLARRSRWHVDVDPQESL